MATARRVFWETTLFLGFLVVLGGVVIWSGGRVERHSEELTGEHALHLAAAQEQHKSEISTLEQSWTETVREADRQRAEAVIQAFESGIHTAAVARWSRYLESATSLLLEDSAVTFVHLLTSRGRIISSSDQEMRTRGRVADDDVWPLEVSELASRESGEPPVLELALPVVENGQTVAIVWIGYDLGRQPATTD